MGCVSVLFFPPLMSSLQIVHEEGQFRPVYTGAYFDDMNPELQDVEPGLDPTTTARDSFLKAGDPTIVAQCDCPPVLAKFGLFINKHHGLVICDQCSEAVSPTKIVSHLKNCAAKGANETSRHLLPTPVELTEIATVTKDLKKSSNYMPYSVAQGPQDPNPIIGYEVDGVPVYGGYSCVCGYACQSPDVSRKHKCHATKVKGASVQRPFGHGSYFAVKRIRRDTSIATDEDVALIHDNTEALEELYAPEASRGLDRRHTNPFLVDSGFLSFSEKLKLTTADIAKLSERVKGPAEEEIDLVALKGLVTVYIKEIVQKFDVDQDDLLRRYLQSVECASSIFLSGWLSNYISVRVSVRTNLGSSTGIRRAKGMKRRTPQATAHWIGTQTSLCASCASFCGPCNSHKRSATSSSPETKNLRRMLS
jgi:hypothetical protein